MFIVFLDHRVAMHQLAISTAQSALAIRGTDEEIKRKARYDILHHSTQMVECLAIRTAFLTQNRAQV